MAKVYIGESLTRDIIKRLYQRNYVAGLICELCWLRNFRVSDVRHARVSDFRKNNGYAEYYLRNDKVQTNEWYPIPEGIYNKIRDYIGYNNLRPENYVFEITVTQPGAYYNHVGVITHEHILYLWYSVCKHLGIYTETPINIKKCSKCDYAIAKGKCRVYGWDRVKRRATVHIKQCMNKKNTIRRLEKHPRLHETLRGSGAKSKVLFYMDQGKTYEESLLKVFNMSNWRSWKVFKEYMDMAFEKEIGDNTFIKDFGNKILVES